MAVVISFENPASAERGLKPLSDIVAPGMARVNSLILEKAGSDVDLIPELAKHLIDSGGKRLRPMLTIAAAEMCGYPGEGHVKLAASVEFMHTATLLHDDVVDESDLRRGKPSARMVWGNQASVLVGDFLLGQAFQMMVEVGSLDALGVLSQAASIIAEGEVMQLTTAQNLATTEDEYLAVIRAKTAALFSAASEVGPIVAGKGAEERAAMRSFGTNLGLAFQLIDDALDYSGKQKQLGKRVGDDLREGKVTMPVLLAYRRGNQDERAFWKRTLVERDVTDEDLDGAISILRRHKAIDDTVERARHYGAIAADALAIFPEGPHRAALLDAVAFCVSRVH